MMSILWRIARFGRVSMDIHAREKVREFFAAQRLGR